MFIVYIGTEVNTAEVNRSDGQYHEIVCIMSAVGLDENHEFTEFTEFTGAVNFDACREC